MKVLIVDDSDLLQVRLAKAISNADPTISITKAHSCKEAL
jgi:DNA-binding NarL/FixJ family response regulator